ncbi:NACHT, LRR and PYD domains-containing protein 1 homolog isoform 6-T9 [Pholidichthys leucotaenia]
MARRALSTAGGGEIGIGSEIINSFSLLEILHANQFEGEVFDQKLIEQTEENFYRGAPPNWLNFYISEQAESNGTGTSFIKRDGYETLKKQISQRGKGLGTSAIELFHQQGCGGTTLTMQMLWDLRKTFRCAVLTGSTSDIVKVAKEVVHLFTAGPPRKLLGASGNETESSEWTKLEPEVTIMDEVYTYSLHCEKGLYECSLSALRWVCEGRVSFSYRFRSWDEHVNKPVCINHIPAGPLMDITVTAGKMEEVHLPHWFCIDKNVSRSDAFVVLHVDADGDFVEQVSEVTPSHVKLNKPVFSPKGAMILKKLGFKVKIFFDVLIYMRIRTKLMLHVYPMTRDPALQQAVETEEKDNGFRRIRKPSPTKPLRRNSDVSLSADTDGATIRPDNRTLTCTWSTQNFFEVEIDKSESEFSLILKDKQKGTMENVVWSCTILTDDIETKNINNEEARVSPPPVQTNVATAGGKHFVDRHRTALIERVNEISPILDSLLDKQLISQDKYDYIRNKIVFPTSRDQMREIVDMMRLEKQSKDTLYEILKERETLRYLMSDLEGSK